MEKKMKLAVIDLVATLLCAIGIGGMFMLDIANFVGVITRSELYDLAVAPGIVAAIGWIVVMHRVMHDKCTLLD